MTAWNVLLLGLALLAVVFGILQMRKAQQALVEVSKAQSKAEADLKAQRDSLLSEAEKEAARTRERGQKEADALVESARRFIRETSADPSAPPSAGAPEETA